MTDLKTLQYPRWIHSGAHGAKLVQSADECEAALDAGWVLSPGDPPRQAKVDLIWHDTVPDSPSVDVPTTPEPVAESHDEPVKKKPGRSKKS